MTDRTEWYRQCRLRRGRAEQVAWLPEQHAVLARWLRLRDDNGWQVIAVMPTRQPYSQIRAREREAVILPSIEG